MTRDEVSPPRSPQGDELLLKESTDLVLARSKGRETARLAGLGLADQTRLATAISEIVRNVLRYAGTGTCAVTDESDEFNIRVVVVVEDRGPGIEDIELAMTDGYSTGNSLGAGLPATRRITGDFEIESRTDPGASGTRVSFAISRPRAR